MTVLITGFAPFGEDKINPSYEAVNAISLEQSEHQLIKACLPVVFHQSIEALYQLIETHRPDIVLCVGQAGGRTHMTIERVGINIDDARIPDNAGNSPIDQWIVQDGADGYFSNLPIKAMALEMNKKGVPTMISNTAGTFVCNHVLYGLMHYIHKKNPQIKGGFIHVPYLPSQATLYANTASMHLEDIVKGLETAILAACEYQTDIKISHGTTC
ncbi:pyroglutamyl-peptidase I [Fusibacter bizertensis]